MDFGISTDFKICNEERTKRKMDVEGNLAYSSPEMYEAFTKKRNTVEINPFKSDVFAFGLIFLELTNLERFDVKKMSEKRLNEAIENMKNRYKEVLNGVEINTFQRFVKILEKCLSMKAENRPDFISLFGDSLTLNEYDRIQQYILTEDYNNDSCKEVKEWEIRGYSKDKNVSAKIVGKSEKIPKTFFFSSEGYI